MSMVQTIITSPVDIHTLDVSVLKIILKQISNRNRNAWVHVFACEKSTC